MGGTIGNALSRMNEGELFLCALVVFLACILVIAGSAYGILCVYNDKHRLSGTADVTVALLEGTGADQSALHYGCFPILLRDQGEQQAFPFFPRRNWLEKGLPRMYPVMTFLGRFTKALSSTIGLESDASLVLLNRLLDDPVLSSSLGAVFPGKKKTLHYYGLSESWRDKASRRKIIVVSPLARAGQGNGHANTPADEFSRKTGCDIRAIRITLEWKP